MCLSLGNAWAWTLTEVLCAWDWCSQSCVCGREERELMCISWGFGVMAENTQNVNASNLASSGKAAFLTGQLCTSRGWVVPVYLGCGVWSSTAILVLVLLQCKQNLWAIVGACPSVFSACCFALFNLQPSNVTLCRPGRPWFKSKEVDLVEGVRIYEIAGMFKSGLLLILKVASLKWPINTLFTWFAVTRETELLLFSPDIILKPCREE